MQQRANPSNLLFIEQMYQRYLLDPTQVDQEWRSYFASLNGSPAAHADFRVGPSFSTGSLFHASASPQDSSPVNHAHPTPNTDAGLASALLQERVDLLIRNYRVLGHLIAAVDPLGRLCPEPRELDPEFLGIRDQDLDRTCSAASLGGGQQTRTVREIIDLLQTTYCRSIGVQFMHFIDPEMRSWLQQRMESSHNHVHLERDEQLRILRRLTSAVVFERFLQTKYTGAKTFSLEGAETLIPLLDLAIERAAEHGVREIVIAMAHRGRLNVLSNIMGKSPLAVLKEFEDREPELYLGGGDVKYHLGYSTDWTTTSHKSVHLSLCFNPSHLEFINPVALGRTRAKQDRTHDNDRRAAMPLIIHGDAAIAGEGVVQETFALSQLAGYRVGGALHVVVNNQIGFTTPPRQSHSGNYATDIAKMLQSPVFFVNGEDPEAVAQVVRLASDFRVRYQRDAVIDMYCYRKRGHNEGDEPAFTQPLLYSAVNKRRSVRESYLKQLLTLEGVTEEEANQMEYECEQRLEDALAKARSDGSTKRNAWLGGNWRGYRGGPESEADIVNTAVPADRLKSLGKSITQAPEGFHVHPKLDRVLDGRRQMVSGDKPIDWATAEALALASIATDGHRIRITGQDVERGTFSQRHAVLHDVQQGQLHCPLANIAPDQAPVEIHNSPLSENGVLGFEYGYSLDCPSGLIIWEAQFGDFANVAQVIIDQFIVSAEDKWRRLSGLTLLLPHGFEGQGPEHSSARIERFLMLASEDNIQVAVPTNAAQYFHLLRRQVLRKWRKPLVVMTPKKLLRFDPAASHLNDLASGSFQKVIPDKKVTGSNDVDRVLLCSGKVYYDLLQHRTEMKRKDIAIIRVEQLYPFPRAELESALAKYPDNTDIVWVQEEPFNMGAWPFMRLRFGDTLFGRFPLSCVTRVESASPATGSAAAHKMEQNLIVTEAFAGE